MSAGEMQLMNNNENAWYAIRVTYSREIKLRDYLEEKSIKCFVPMHYEIKTVRRKKVRELLPVVHNLIFVYSTRAILDQIKLMVDSILGMRYMMDKSLKVPIVIPENEMRNFIMISGTMDEQLEYTSTDRINLSKNDQVLITGGVFSGVIGRVIGTKKKCQVVVSIPGFIAVITARIDPCLLHKIPKNKHSEGRIIRKD